MPFGHILICASSAKPNTLWDCAYCTFRCCIGYANETEMCLRAARLPQSGTQRGSAPSGPSDSEGPLGIYCGPKGARRASLYSYPEGAQSGPTALWLSPLRGDREAARRPFGPSGVTESGPKALYSEGPLGIYCGPEGTSFVLFAPSFVPFGPPLCLAIARPKGAPPG